MRVESDDGPPDPPPLLVDQNSAPRLLGWSGRRFVAYIKRAGITYGRDRRLYVAKLADVLRSLGLSTVEDHLPPRQPEVPWSRESVVVALQAGARRRVGGR